MGALIGPIIMLAAIVAAGAFGHLMHIMRPDSTPCVAAHCNCRDRRAKRTVAPRP